MSDITGRHALVTGGGSGIGKAAAHALIGAGATVTITGRNAEKLAGAAEELGCSQQVADVTDRERLAAGFESAVEQNGEISILVNNAGVAEASPFARTTDEFWDHIVAVNLHGVYNCTRLVVDAMLEANYGRIINVGSTASLKGYAYISAYTAAKHGVLGMTRSLALEFATKGITVNAVCPGYTETDIVENAIEKITAATGRTRDEAMAELVKQNPQGRMVQPEEVAETIVWLCQQPSMNGQAIAIAGGEVM